MPTPPSRIVGLRAAGTCFTVELTEPVPRVLHWGADLGDVTPEGLTALSLTAEPAILNNAPDIPRRTPPDPDRGHPSHGPRRRRRTPTPAERRGVGPGHHPHLHPGPSRNTLRRRRSLLPGQHRYGALRPLRRPDPAPSPAPGHGDPGLHRQVEPRTLPATPSAAPGRPCPRSTTRETRRRLAVSPVGGRTGLRIPYGRSVGGARGVERRPALPGRATPGRSRGTRLGSRWPLNPEQALLIEVRRVD